MPREIKFRCFVTFNSRGNSGIGRMFPVIRVDLLLGHSFPTVCDDKDYDEEWRVHYSTHGDYYVMQYTGLKDKNGKEIYEGDILKIDFDFIAEVYFEHGMFLINTKEDVESVALIEWADGMGEVIGNIYENPELLEEEANEG